MRDKKSILLRQLELHRRDALGRALPATEKDQIERNRTGLK
jgi:hypothetical protein